MAILSVFFSIIDHSAPSLPSSITGGGASTVQPVSGVAVPAIILDHVSQLDDEFALFVLLAGFEGAFVLPSQRRLAALAEDVGDGVEAGEEETLLRRTAAHVHHRVEEVGAALTAL